MGNKSDLRDPRGAGCQVNQERALSFARAHNMTFFQTSAKSPPGRASGGGRGDGVGEGEEAPFRQDAVEDIVLSVGAKLKRQKRPPAYGGSFQVASRGVPEKEPWLCC